MKNYFSTELIPEPYLEFGDNYQSTDPKTGIGLGGFYSLTNQGHKSEVHYAIIGTKNNLQDTKDWMDDFNNRLQAETKIIGKTKTPINEIIDGQVYTNDDEDDEDNEDENLTELFSSVSNDDLSDEITYKINKNLNPDFPGFTKNSIFQCEFVNDDSNNKNISGSKIEEILEDSEIKPIDKALKIADLYITAYSNLLEQAIFTKPNLCLIIIPKNVFKQIGSIGLGRGKYFNFRRYVKAQLICKSNAIPVQIILEETIRGTKKSLQDKSMQGWNLAVSSYYKNGSIPWTLTLKEKHSCFIGISFHKIVDSDDNSVRASIAQAFNYEGKGIIFIGKQFDWNKKEMGTPAPHLKYEYAKEMIVKVLEQYKAFNNNLPPTRVVVHKTTDFWDTAINKDYAEVEGFRDGITEYLGENAEIDLVTIKSTNMKLLREWGEYPIFRGAMMKMNDKMALFYTTGYIPYYETFPGMHIPHGFEVSIYSGDNTIRKICEEILALSKLNFNNCNYYDSLPITLRFSKKVGEIVEYISEGDIAPNRYFYYM